MILKGCLKKEAEPCYYLFVDWDAGGLVKFRLQIWVAAAFILGRDLEHSAVCCKNTVTAVFPFDILTGHLHSEGRDPMMPMTMAHYTHFWFSLDPHMEPDPSRIST